MLTRWSGATIITIAVSATTMREAVRSSGRGRSRRPLRRRVRPRPRARADGTAGSGRDRDPGRARCAIAAACGTAPTGLRRAESTRSVSILLSRANRAHQPTITQRVRRPRPPARRAPQHRPLDHIVTPSVQVDADRALGLGEASDLSVDTVEQIELDADDAEQGHADGAAKQAAAASPTAIIRVIALVDQPSRRATRVMRDGCRYWAGPVFAVGPIHHRRPAAFGAAARRSTGGQPFAQLRGTGPSFRVP